MKGEMNFFDDAFFGFARSSLTDPDSLKGYTLRSELVCSHLGVELKHFHLAVPDDDILYAMHRELGLPYRAKRNSEQGTSRRERLVSLNAEIAEGWKKSEEVLR